jgi:hypothetical protein
MPELTFQSSAHERYDTDLLSRVEAALAATDGIAVTYREGGCGDMESPTGADNHFGVEGDLDAVGRAAAAVLAVVKRPVVVSPEQD